MNLLNLDIVNMIASGNDSGYDFRINEETNSVELWHGEWKESDDHAPTYTLHGSFPILSESEDDKVNIHQALIRALFAGLGYIDAYIKAEYADPFTCPIPEGVYRTTKPGWEMFQYPFFAPAWDGPTDGTKITYDGYPCAVVERRVIHGHEFALLVTGGYTTPPLKRCLALVHSETEASVFRHTTLETAFEQVEKMGADKINKAVIAFKKRKSPNPPPEPPEATD
jgi:hypothetical protein